LEDVFLDEFQLIFVHANRETRWARIKDLSAWGGAPRENFERLDNVDSDEKSVAVGVGETGQEVRKLCAHADYYIVNHIPRSELRLQGVRFFELMVGVDLLHPTECERSMHLAFSAASHSACLSRQVGAALFDENGNLLGVGHNDPPKFGGGQYLDNKAQDKRCYNDGSRACANHMRKSEEIQRMCSRVQTEFESFCVDSGQSIPESPSFVAGTSEGKPALTKELVKEIANETLQKSCLKDVTEYCRAVHAEMETLLSVSRMGRGGTLKSAMYVTTQPCHNCTKHLLASGVRKVVYIEPYPKSLAGALHSDAVELDPSHDGTAEKPSSLAFIPYRGVAPRRFLEFFIRLGDLKDKATGLFLETTISDRILNPRFPRRIRNRTRADMTDPSTVQETRVADEVGELLTEKEINIISEVTV
jgi:deoxycytidylate deaminase